VPLVVVLDHTVRYMEIVVAVVMVEQEEVIPVVMGVQTVEEMEEEEEMAAGVGVVINERSSTVPACTKGVDWGREGEKGQFERWWYRRKREK
jgi:hypothetical protein